MGVDIRRIEDVEDTGPAVKEATVPLPDRCDDCGGLTQYTDEAFEMELARCRCFRRPRKSRV